MPVEEFTDINLGTDEKTFDELDRAAAKAAKTLEKRNTELKKSLSNASKAEREIKRLGKRGGIFGIQDKLLSSSGAPLDIAASKQQSFEEKILEKVRKNTLTDQAGGTKEINTLFELVRNPKKFAIGLLRSIPFIGGIVAASEFAQALISELEKVDRFFKKFIDIIDDRANQLRDKVEIAHIRAGDIQEIHTTKAGGTEPREGYNTFNEFNENRVQLEIEYAVRNKDGV